MPDLVVAGAGMAGLTAAAEARRLGADPLVLEKLPYAGGSMRLSSGVVWRHREFDTFRAECPDGDERLQRLVFERLDEDLGWLESLGAPVVERDTGNPLTTGLRLHPDGLTSALVAAVRGIAGETGGGAAAAGRLRLGEPLREPPEAAPLILATGGFAASRELLAEHVTPEAEHVFLRTSPGSTGDGLRIGLEAGAATSTGLDEVYARAMPAPPARIGEHDLVRLSQLYAKHAIVTNEHGDRYETRTWSENDVAGWQVRQPRARAWFTVPADRLGERVRDRTVAEMVEAAEVAGAPVTRGAEGVAGERGGAAPAGERGGAAPAGERGRGGGGRFARPVRRGADDVTVETVAGVTTTLGGLAIDESGRAASGVFACGADAGGIATGGYASGLAAALVCGRLAARAALGETP
jgi:succinate dehydrogenase/fumarate reductase flavoprotein subunit